MAVKRGWLAPNSTYEPNGYKYTTDEHGRINAVEGELRAEPIPTEATACKATSASTTDGRPVTTAAT